MNKKIKIVFSVLLMTAFIFNSQKVLGESKKTVSILFTHDMHSHIDVERNVKDGKERENGGLAKVKTVKDRTEDRYSGTFLVDAGDFAMGTPFQTVFRERASELKTMAEVGFDATTLGNHEFDYRAKGLGRMFEEAANYNKGRTKMPSLVAGNIDWEKSFADKNKMISENAKVLKKSMDKYGVADYSIIEKNGVKMAVFGVLGREAVENAPAAGLKFKDFVSRAKEIVKEIKKNGGYDIIVCLSHSGTDEKDFDKSEDVELAKSVPDIDLIVSGHSHTELKEAKTVGNTHIVSCGAYNHNIGHIVLKKDGERYRIDKYELIKLDESVEGDKDIQKVVDRFKKNVDNDFFKKYGYSSNTVLAKNENKFTDVNSLGKKQGEDPLGNLIADSYLDIANKNLKGNEPKYDLSLVPAGVIRGSLGTGKITAADAFNISSLGIGEDEKVGYPLVSVYLTGKELKAVAEVDGTVSDKMDEARLYMSGLGYTINRNRLFLNRVTDVRLIDKEGNTTGKIDNDKLYHVVGGLYSCQMLSYVKDQSHGLLSIEPKDKNGNVIKDFNKHIIYDKNGNEIKEWYALATYIDNFKNKEIPSYYGKTHNRKIIDDSWNPIKLLKQPNHIFVMLLGIILIPVAIIIGIIILIVKRRRNRGGRYGGMFNGRSGFYGRKSRRKSRLDKRKLWRR